MRLVWGAHAKPTNRGALAAPPITGGPAPKLAGHDTTSRALPARYQAPQGWPLAPQALPEAPAVASAVRDGVPPSNCVLPRRLLSGVHASPQALCDGQLQRTRPPPGSCPISCRPLGSVHVQRHGHCPPLDPGLSLAIAFHWPRPLSRETPDSRPVIPLACFPRIACTTTARNQALAGLAILPYYVHGRARAVALLDTTPGNRLVPHQRSLTKSQAFSTRHITLHG